MRVLITGEKGYIGANLADYLNRDEYFSVSRFSLRNGFSSYDLTGFDAVIHAAALVHQNEKKFTYEDYYEINTALTRDLAESAVAAGVGHFIFLSTMAVYEGYLSREDNFFIGPETDVSFRSSYASSKYGAEDCLREFEDKMTVTVIRPPLVYGYGSPGNFHRLARLAGKLKYFPMIENARSMIYIDNLSELMRLILIHKKSGLVCPQNGEYINSSKLFYDFSRIKGNDAKPIKTPEFIKKAGSAFNIYKKLFFSLAYEKGFTSHFDNEYIVTGYEESLKRSLGAGV